ncbi:glycosyltransferase [Erythrobacter sp. SCSIO 43205]|uniref:CgeB family protein n=1 Tax=Erythrobacter sp. SCSIO 43205 TaxID=2779361 RepID=UPI001CA8AC92|nr:glycosyltransferase [Erythrobacter sp. SCSIO 43205]UAB77826.1 glycosyltransferase [Erythrobacter sp. SCSIO 43205]
MVDEYMRLRREAFRLKNLVEKTPSLRNNFQAFMDQDDGDFQYNAPSGRFKSEIVAATIMDEFSNENWSPEFCNIALSFRNWRTEIDFFQPDFLFVESAWNGNFSEWSFALEAPRSHSSARELDRLIKFCKQRSIPCIFWNKEDPLHFEKFLSAASLFDLVFTTDQQSVPRYREQLGHNRVFTLPFAAQPSLCNPVRKTEARDHRPFFAGSYYVSNHGTRTEQMNMLFDAMLEKSGVIYDRNFNSDSSDVRMPDKYRPICEPPVPFDEMVEVYRRHILALNVNSVTDSTTMMSRRVFEILACSTPVVSTPSRAIDCMLGDVVTTVYTFDQAATALDLYIGNESDADLCGHKGYRCVHRNHTYRHRLEDITTALDQSMEGSCFSNRLTRRPQEFEVSVFLASNRPSQAMATLKTIDEQTHKMLDLFLMAGPNFSRADIEEVQRVFPDIRVLSVTKDGLERQTIGDLSTHADGDCVLVVRDCDRFGAEMLADILLPLRYTTADIIGKASYFCYNRSDGTTWHRNPSQAHQYVDALEGGPLLLTAKAMRLLKDLPYASSNWQALFAEAKRQGLKVYSSDQYNFTEESYQIPHGRRLLSGSKVDELVNV